MMEVSPGTFNDLFRVCADMRETVGVQKGTVGLEGAVNQLALPRCCWLVPSDEAMHNDNHPRLLP